MVPAAMLEFLKWVGAGKRSYADAMDAWQTSCPRLSVWEDASIARYVELRATDGRTLVVLTDAGKAIVDGT